MRVSPLVVKPVLLYSRYVRVGLSSWRNWGDGLDVDGEVSRINGELACSNPPWVSLLSLGVFQQLVV